LADFQKRLHEFESRGFKVVAASVDSHADAEEMIDGQKVIFPLGYGLNAKEIAAACGAFYDAERRFLHATGFLLRPDGSVCNAVYSTGSIGRLTPGDSLRVLEYFKKQGS
jgi:alkyl hydroperoxide reductase subunit AhpC